MGAVHPGDCRLHIQRHGIEAALTGFVTEDEALGEQTGGKVLLIGVTFPIPQQRPVPVRIGHGQPLGQAQGIGHGPNSASKRVSRQLREERTPRGTRCRKRPGQHVPRHIRGSASCDRELSDPGNVVVFYRRP